MVANKEKSITFKKNKGSDSNREMNIVVVSDESSSPNKEGMSLLAKKFTKFFKNKKRFFSKVKKRQLEYKGLEISEE